MAPPLLLLQDIRLTLGTAPLLDGAELSVSAGDRLCLIGRNGSGKSTLLKIAAGLLASDREANSFNRVRLCAICHRSPIFPLSKIPWPMSRPDSGQATTNTGRATCWSS